MASGKRLAERNRLAREAKKKAEAEAASAAAQPIGNTPTQSENTNKEKSSISLMTILGIGGLLVSAAGVYYQREAIMKSFKPSQAPAPAPQAATPQEATPQASTPAPSRIPVKCGIRKIE